ncbi:MAG: hypothetical protein ACFFDW_11095 [Candidatus Thorarchaeota archaeon]
MGRSFVFSSYIFTYPAIGRDNIASLVVVFESMEYNSEMIKNAFAEIVLELRKQKIGIIDTLTKILPSIFLGIEKGFVKIQISSITTIEVKFADDEEKDIKKKAVKSFTDDIWT